MGWIAERLGGDRALQGRDALIGLVLAAERRAEDLIGNSAVVERLMVSAISCAPAQSCNANLTSASADKMARFFGRRASRSVSTSSAR